jgi:hypothetical protein
MPKYIFQAMYSGEGIRGLEKDKALGRKAVLGTAVESLAGKLEALYCTIGFCSLTCQTMPAPPPSRSRCRGQVCCALLRQPSLARKRWTPLSRRRSISRLQASCPQANLPSAVGAGGLAGQPLLFDSAHKQALPKCGTDALEISLGERPLLARVPRCAPPFPGRPGTCASGRFDPFFAPSGNDRYWRVPAIRDDISNHMNPPNAAVRRAAIEF